MSDWYGEKLDEIFTAQAIHEALPESGWSGFAMLAPEGEPSPDRYALYWSDDGKSGRPDGAALDAALRRNPHYDYCRRIGQLKCVAVRNVAVNSRIAAQLYLGTCTRRGRVAGTVKHSVLDQCSGWNRVFPLRLEEHHD